MWSKEMFFPFQNLSGKNATLISTMEDEVKGHLAVVHRLVKNVYCITGDYSSTHPSKSHFLSSFPLFFLFSACICFSCFYQIIDNNHFVQSLIFAFWTHGYNGVFTLTDTETKKKRLVWNWFKVFTRPRHTDNRILWNQYRSLSWTRLLWTNHKNLKFILYTNRFNFWQISHCNTAAK